MKKFDYFFFFEADAAMNTMINTTTTPPIAAHVITIPLDLIVNFIETKFNKTPNCYIIGKISLAKKCKEKNSKLFLLPLYCLVRFYYLPTYLPTYLPKVC